MKYRIYVDFTKKKKDGTAPVVLIFEGSGKRFKLSTGLCAVNNIVGRAFQKGEPCATAKNAVLAKKLLAVDQFMLLRGDNMPVDELKDELRLILSNRQKSAKTLVHYIERFADTKERKGTRDLYDLAARKVAAYDAKATFEDVDVRWLDGFVRSMGDVSVNYQSIMLRNIRTVFNWAIDNEWTDKYPFRRYKIKSEKVAINNITVEQLRAVRDYPLDDDWRCMYRDLFMLVFYLCGINPVDLLHLKKENMKNGRIRYKRAKTGRLYDIPVLTEAREIIERYRGKEWLLCPLDRFGSHKDFDAHWNAALKKIGPVRIVPDKVGRMRKMEWDPIVEGMTIYTARYTFASIGAELDIPRETIALCLGHAWTDVTSRYISYDNKKIDGAVKKIIGYVNKA